MYNVPVKEVIDGKVQTFVRLTLDDMEEISEEIRLNRKQIIKKTAKANGVDEASLPRALMQIDLDDFDMPEAVRQYAGTSRGARRILQQSLADRTLGTPESRLASGRARYAEIFTDEWPDREINLAMRLCRPPIDRDQASDDFLLGRVPPKEVETQTTPPSQAST